MVVLDASMLLLFLRPESPGPRDAAGDPVPYSKQRIEHLIGELDKSGTRIAIPTPALSEVLIRADIEEAQKIVETLNREAIFSIEPFDQRAAIEVAAMLRQELGRKRPKEGEETWAKLKYDRQIVAIAKICGATAIYSEDNDIHTIAARMNIPVYRVSDLALPPGQLQTNLLNDLEKPNEEG